jgi:RimJ/RimL family protein N-acetyltransferase
MRRAQESDSRLFWEWANDPQVRAAAFSSDPISWEQHNVWYASKMKDPDCRIFVAENGQGLAVGQFRVDWHDLEGEIDVSVSAKCRGSGYGAVLIDLGVRSAFMERGERLHAFVKTDNQGSRRAFEQAGFTNLGEESIRRHSVIHYVRSRENH